MLLALEGAALSRKHDYALFVLGGISYTYMTRPALFEAAAKRVLNIRQVFEEMFR